MTKKAFITGITGQDGAYLAKLLLEKGYHVFGGVRRSSSNPFERLSRLGIKEEIQFVNFDLLEQSNISKVIEEIKPDEFYNLGAQSFVGASFEQPIYTSYATGMSVAYILESLRRYSPGTRYYQASTSEMFGKVVETPQSEKTPFYPRSPYGVAKLYAHWLTINYRESYNMFNCSGILFNHESPLRGEEFVTRKITVGIAEIKHGIRKKIELGNLYAKRDWGFAGDFVEGMWKMVNHSVPDDYVLATGETHSIKEFVDLAFACAEIPLRWEGEGINEKAYHGKTGEVLLEINPQFYRPAEVDLLIGDPTKAKTRLNWNPKMGFQDLVKLMTESDLAWIKKTRT
ncbi:MAG: GDP-mannose 4,6-dehydratase [Bacteriovoracaceae bacterium]